MGDVVAEVVAEVAGDFARVFFEVVRGFDVACGEAVAHVDHLKADVFVFFEAGHEVFGFGDGVVPLADVALLASDVEGDSVGGQAEVTGKDEEVVGHVGVAAEFAREGPVGGDGVFDEDADVHFGAGGMLGDVFEVFLAVRCVHAYAFFVKARDVCGFFDGVAVADSFGGDVVGHDFVEFIAGCDVEVGSKLGQEADDLRCRVCFCRVID